MPNNEMPVLSREHFYDLLEAGQEEFRIKTVTPGKNKREISEDAPFDRDDPMSYVLVNIVFDDIEIFAKGEFSNHDIAESQRIYADTIVDSPKVRLERLEKQVKQLLETQAASV